MRLVAYAAGPGPVVARRLKRCADAADEKQPSLLGERNAATRRRAERACACACCRDVSSPPAYQHPSACGALSYTLGVLCRDAVPPHACRAPFAETRKAGEHLPRSPGARLTAGWPGFSRPPALECHLNCFGHVSPQSNIRRSPVLAWTEAASLPGKASLYYTGAWLTRRECIREGAQSAWEAAAGRSRRRLRPNPANVD